MLKDQEREKKRVEAEGLEGKEPWIRNHVLPQKHVQISQTLPDAYAKGVKKEDKMTLKADKWESAYLLLARTIQDDLVVGKEPFNTFNKKMKAEDKNKDFAGNAAPFKVI